MLSQYAIIVNELITAQLARDLEAVNQSVEQLIKMWDVRSDFLQNMNLLERGAIQAYFIVLLST